MTTCPKMQRVLEALAAKHNLNLAGPEPASLTLRLPGIMPLFVEFHAVASEVCVAHYKEQSDETVPDPEIWLKRGRDGLAPLAMNTLLCPMQCRTPAEVADVAQFVEDWAEVIEQRYLVSNEATVECLA